jgi:hypothetical protein
MEEVRFCACRKKTRAFSDISVDTSRLKVTVRFFPFRYAATHGRRRWSGNARRCRGGGPEGFGDNFNMSYS